MLIAQYGNTIQPSAQEAEGFANNANFAPKTGLSSFDLMLDSLGNAQANKGASLINVDSSVETPYSGNGFKQLVLSDMTTENPSLEKTSDQVVDERKVDIQKEDDKSSHRSQKTTDIHPGDVTYLQTINEKMNALMDKLKRTKNLSEHDFSLLGTELNNLMHQMQLFTQSKHHGSQDYTTTSSAMNAQEKALQQLLQGMNSKLKQIQEMMQNIGFSVKKDFRVSPAAIDGNLEDMAKLDRELDKTKSLLQELKKAAQSDHMLSSHNIKNFQQNINQSMSTIQWNNHHSAHLTHVPVKMNSSVSAGNSSPLSITGSNNASDNMGSSSSGNHSQFEGSASDGLNRFPSLISNGKMNLQDASSLSQEDRISLGKEILNQLQSQMQGFIGKDKSHFSISLKPEELGNVQVIMDMQGKDIKSQIIVENEVVKSVLQQKFDDMKAMFHAHGISVSELTVKTQSEYQGEQKSQREDIQGIQNTYHQAASQVKLNRHISNNTNETHWLYEKSVDHLDDKEFIITA